MKNQWFGDIHDFRKYGLLTFLSKFYNDVYVDWMLTEDIPNTKDGKIIKYASKHRKHYWAPLTASKIQKQIWDYLHHFHFNTNNDRHVLYGMEILSKMNNNCNFFSSLDYNCDTMIYGQPQICNRLIFFDADNGLANNIPNKKIINNEDPHYISADKVEQYLKNQFSVLIYQHNTLSCLRPFSKLCEHCIQTLSIDKEDIVIFKGGHVVYFLIEKRKNIQKEIIKKFEFEKFSSKYLALFNI